MPLPNTQKSNSILRSSGKAVATVLSAGLLAVSVLPGWVQAQNPEMRERICRNLDNEAKENDWPDRAEQYDAMVGDYDDRERTRSSRDWRISKICDGKYVWARALFGDVAPFPLQPTEDPSRFVDFRGNQWIITVDDDGKVEKLEWIWESQDRRFTYYPVR